MKAASKSVADYTDFADYKSAISAKSAERQCLTEIKGEIESQFVKSESLRDWEPIICPVQRTLAFIAFALLLSGCQSVYKTEVPTSVYPTPPVPLSEFLNNPVDGIYSLPDVASSPSAYFSHNIMLVSGGVVRLSRFQNGRISTNDWDFTEFKRTLPSEADFQQLTTESTEQDIEHLFGKPTREGFDRYPFIGIKSRTTKHSGYSWFTLSPSSEFITMVVWVYYVKSQDGQWVVDELTWDKNGGRRFTSNQQRRE